eukprot:CAMPEP_0178426738 /NCGR_PEP_ID=MMETSP0689_2-20121128/29387_1 /TAXON_ID=160604 /ORGANISM="Amphidinium massartii, Strain CS-259" /LENGTH=102 /DNA_ID=CAMNT_0020048429 /DNA_START=913 /DNA_END=1218 /DNA_ORIENTATION=+
MRTKPMKDTVHAESITCALYSCSFTTPVLPSRMQNVLHSHEGAHFMKHFAAGMVYSFETCRNQLFSGLLVGAHQPPQHGILNTHGGIIDLPSLDMDNKRPNL